MDAREKYGILLDWLRKNGKALLAFSGGADSTFLLKALIDAGTGFVPVNVVTPFIAHGDQINAKLLGRFLDRQIELLTVNNLPDEVLANDTERCYYCKKYIFNRLITFAEREGCTVVYDGSNLDDLNDFRPGARALRELGVASPLREAGFTKNEIRALSKEMNLPTWNRIANSCLAARIPYNTRIDYRRLEMIEAAEEFLRERGFTVVRVRDHGEIARIEVDEDQKKCFADSALSREVEEYLKKTGWRYVTLDLGGYRSGSMNEGLV